jgi:hypothetical protein
MFIKLPPLIDFSVGLFFYRSPRRTPPYGSQNFTASPTLMPQPVVQDLQLRPFMTWLTVVCLLFVLHLTILSGQLALDAPENAANAAIANRK